jgi:hypothetical protein
MDWEFEDEKINGDVLKSMEDSMMTVVHSHMANHPGPAKSKTFMTRPAYIDLETQGLTELPPVQAVFLSYHSSGCQWHAAYPIGDRVVNRAPKWADDLRTEREALLLALTFLWRTHVNQTDQGTDQLSKLEAASAAS